MARQPFTSDRRSCKSKIRKLFSFRRLRRSRRNSKLDALSGREERKKRVHRKDRIIHVERTVQVMEERIDPRDYLGIFNDQGEDVNRARLGTTTTIIGGAENIHRHEEQMRKQAEAKAEHERPKTLVNKISVSKMYEGFSEAGIKATITIQQQTESIYDPVNSHANQTAINQQEISPTKFEKIQDSMWKVGASVDKAINTTQHAIQHSSLLNRSPTQLPQPKETELERDIFYFHNPPHLNPQHDSTQPGLVSNVTETIYRTIARRPKTQKATILPLDHADNLGEKGIEEVKAWAATTGIIDWEEADYFIACTTAQLKELNSETIDRVRVIKNLIGPPTSPAPEKAETDNMPTETDQDEKDFTLNPNRGLINLTPEQITNYDDFTPIEFNPYTIHKDLSKHLGIRNFGIQVLGTNIPDTHSSPDNLSTFYRIPLVESSEQFKSNYIFKKDGDETVVDDRASVASSASSDHDQTENIFYPIHTQPPAQSLILYLMGKGLDTTAIAKILAPLDEKFVYKWDSRWFNGFRVPDHWEMNDQIVEQVKAKCKAESQWWEEELDCSGKKIGVDLRVLKERMKARKATYFVKKVVENYLWWRCRMGEKCHKDLLRM